MSVLLKKFLATDLTTVAAATTLSNGVGFNSRVINIEAFLDVAIWGYATGGDAAYNDDVIFTFGASPDSVYWTPVASPILTITLPVLAAAGFAKEADLTTLGYQYLRLDTIRNDDVAKTAVLVNAYAMLKYPRYI